MASLLPTFEEQVRPDRAALLVARFRGSNHILVGAPLVGALTRAMQTEGHKGRPYDRPAAIVRCHFMELLI
jgi:hypothetical protein